MKSFEKDGEVEAFWFDTASSINDPYVIFIIDRTCVNSEHCSDSILSYIHLNM